ncbi:hypothetical protein ACIQ62_28740 [Streptomyces sp. NPDC096319]|uniref:hypothetical protein n=1 Tax=Streptomyces sp. NPDC096319 TaxID=3366084 RepID=UPI0037FC6F7C
MVTAGARPTGVMPGGGYTAVIEVAREPDGTFHWTNLNIAAAGDEGRGILRPAPFPALTSGLVADGWGQDDRSVYYADADGAIIELRTDGTSWAFKNLTSRVGVPVAAWNSPFALAGTRSRTMMLYYVEEDGQLVVMKARGTWSFMVKRRIPKVPAKSALAALQNGRGRFLYFLDKRDHVIEVEGFGQPATRITDLTAYARLPAASPLSGLTAVGWGYDHRRIYYTNTDDNLIEMLGFGGEGENGWQWQNLGWKGVGQLKDGSPLSAAPTAGPVEGVALWGRESAPLWAKSGSGWNTQEIHTTREGARPVVAAHSSVACAAGTDHRPWVSYLGEDGHLALWRGPESDWLWWDLTADLKLPAAAQVAPQGPLALIHTERGPRLYYLTDEPEF